MTQLPPIRLSPVNHTGPRMNRYCGPSALSILTGLDTGRTAALLRRISGARSIRGTGTSTVKQALWSLGINMSWVAVMGRRPTLVQWLKQTRDQRGDNTYLLAVGKHWAIIQGRRYACGIVRKPVPFKDSPKRRARVTEVYALSRISRPDYDEVIPQFVAPIDTERKPRIEAKRLAAQYHIEIDDSGRPSEDLRWVYPPSEVDGVEFPDPRADEHYGYGWQEVLDVVQEYVAAIDAFRAARGKALVDSGVDTSSRAICLDSQPASAILAP